VGFGAGHNPLCVALDSRDASEIERLAAATQEHVGVFKVGVTAFTAAGPRLVARLEAHRPVFLDLKLHDIPAQVEGAVRAVVACGATYTTVHASGGPDMIAAAVSGADGGLTVLAVTVLTSLDERSLTAMGMCGSVPDQVLRLADLALEAGASGLVCSGHEVGAVRTRFGSAHEGGPLLVVPGVRPAGEVRGDQRRTTTPREALERGADLVVVGRPITGARDPREAARRIGREMSP
jgi:orotidine-5'-phosphate decarboxylase